MEKYNPNTHHRCSIRMKGYDYSKLGMYFITVCCKNMEHRFGKIENQKMILNDFGKIAYNEWLKLSERYPHVSLDTFQIMPNHFHGIIQISNVAPVGAGLAPALVGNNDKSLQGDREGRPYNTVGNIIGAYKSLVVNQCLKICKSRNEYMGELWQCNYYEHIIRNNRSYQFIANYITNNPANWRNDRFNHIL
jgi:REP element-mobilizing transposase RayT